MDEHTHAQPAAPAPPPPAVSERPPETRRRSGIGIWIVLALVVVAIVLWHPWRAKPVAAVVAQPQPVSVAAVRRGDMPVVLIELGTVTPLATITVQSQISGYLQQVLFTEGQEVRKGDLLALVDPRPYQVQLEQAQAQLARDTASLGQAKMDLARYQTLGKQESIAKQTLQDQVFTVAQDQAVLKSDQSTIDTQELNIAYCHITSPVDGRVGLRQIDAGNYVTASSSTGLVVVTQIKPISVIFTVTEDEVQPILTRLGNHATLTVDAYDRTDTVKLAEGTVETIDNQVDTSTGTVKLRANYPNTDERLFPNEFVNAHLLLETLSDVLIVPAAAIQNGPQGSFVYVVDKTAPDSEKTAPDTPGIEAPGTEKAGTEKTGRHQRTRGHADGKVVVRLVKTGITHADETVIASGLAAGESVVIDGTDRLHDGAMIAIPSEHGKPTQAAGKPNE